MFKKFLLSSIILCIPTMCVAYIPLPARIGGLVTVDGTALTQATASKYTFQVKRTDGSSLSPLAENSGLNSSNCYIIDIPIYNASDQAGGVNPGDALVIYMCENGTQLYVTSPSHGRFTCGDSGSTTQINIKAQTKPPSGTPVGIFLLLGGIFVLDPLFQKRNKGPF